MMKHRTSGPTRWTGGSGKRSLPMAPGMGVYTLGKLRGLRVPRESQDRSRATAWQAVDPEADFTRQFQLTGLTAGSRYHLKVEARPAGATEPTCTLPGGFETGPQATTSARVAFTVVTCQEYPLRDDPENGHRIYPLM